MTGFELLERIQAEPALRNVPVVVFTGKDLDTDEEARLRTVAKSIVLKDVQSPERLLDETSLFLHRVISELPDEKRQCWSAFTTRTRCSGAERCWSSTMTPVTFLPSPPSWKTRRWTL